MTQRRVTNGRGVEAHILERLRASASSGSDTYSTWSHDALRRGTRYTQPQVRNAITRLRRKGHSIDSVRAGKSWRYRYPPESQPVEAEVAIDDSFVAEWIENAAKSVAESNNPMSESVPVGPATRDVPGTVHGYVVDHDEYNRWMSSRLREVNVGVAAPSQTFSTFSADNAPTVSYEAPQPSSTVVEVGSIYGDLLVMYLGSLYRMVHMQL